MTVLVYSNDLNTQANKIDGKVYLQEFGIN